VIDGERLRVAVLLRRLRPRNRRSRTPDLLGRCERAALATALAVKREAGAQVTALAVGPARYEQRALQLALRAGCDRAVGVLYPAADSVDYLGVARVIAAALRRDPVDLVVCGSRSQDEVVGAVGPAVAELLDLPHLSSLVDLSLQDGTIVAVRRAAGKLHRFSCRPPLVACIDEFRRAAVDGARAASRAEVVSVQLGELDVRAAELSVRSDFAGSARTTRARAATIVSGAAELVSRLADDELLGG
jgi:electron transfer flavoprotein beta subunit